MAAAAQQAVIRSFTLPVRVYLEDTDAQGFVYNASYFRFMERARTECLREAGVDHEACHAQYGVRFVLARVAASFAAPSQLSDILSVSADVTEIRGARMIFDQKVHRGESPGTLVCSATAEVACMDAVSRRPRRFPEAILSEWN